MWPVLERINAMKAGLAFGKGRGCLFFAAKTPKDVTSSCRSPSSAGQIQTKGAIKQQYKPTSAASKICVRNRKNDILNAPNLFKNSSSRNPVEP
jgi:hypothetical protein